MSRNIRLMTGPYLQDGRGVCVSQHLIQEGGTQVMGGTHECDLNITGNYSRLYHLALDKEDGLSWLYGKRAKDTIERLEKAVELLSTDQYVRTVDNCNKCGFRTGVGKGLADPYSDENRRGDYWAPTPGNAGYALNILLGWAREFPEGEWDLI